MGLRVRPAQFARMLGVSRQSVSRWIQQGKVLVDPSGRLDPVKATERVMQHADPARLRATLLKPVMDDMAGLRTELQEATARADRAEQRAEAAEVRAERAAARADEAEANVSMVEAAGDRFIDAVVTRLQQLAALEDPETARAQLEDLYMEALDAAAQEQAAAAAPAVESADASADATEFEAGPSLDISDLDLTPEPFEFELGKPGTGDPAPENGGGGRGLPPDPAEGGRTDETGPTREADQ
ncbi:hypothetical protein [Thioalkalivibrio sp. ALR17-21]|uniref:hypothetical protein n=1 Tax=Thioalkalivibrio sp. ALR17-21 TaxID=1269813 RepID=UPI0004040480|nr:hypothetical protein [Thioalkalivibrio sp. ALR17-21]